MSIMKKVFLLAFLMISSQMSFGQNGITRLLSAGLDDANTFADSYLSPGTDALAMGLSNGWFNTAKADSFGGFEVSVMANISIVSPDQQEFLLDEADYDILQFQDKDIGSQMVANVLGADDPEVAVKAVYEDNGITNEVNFNLPQGLANEKINSVPGAMIQASAGLFSGFEISARYLPEVQTDDVSAQLYGVGLKNELTNWLPFDKLFPFHIAGFVGYTKFDGKLKVENNFATNTAVNRYIESEMESWNYAAIVSTKLPLINFYGSIGYIQASSSSDLIGTYQIDKGPLGIETVKDPISVSSDASSIQANLGFKLDLKFIRINGQYSIQEFDTVTVGLSFGI